MKPLRPFFSFYGSKWRLAPRYPQPEYHAIVEPFAGSAGYSLHNPYKQVFLFDRDPIIVGVWDYLIRVSEEEVRALPDIEPGQSVDDLALTVCEEARWLIGFWLNQGSAQPKKKPSKWMTDPKKAKSFWGPQIRERIASQLHAIRHWVVAEGSYADIPNSLATWFVDPPYQDAGKYYRYKDVDYEHLAGWCRSRWGSVIVCENLGANWLPFEHFTHIQGTKKKSTEVVWTTRDVT